VNKGFQFFLEPGRQIQGGGRRGQEGWGGNIIKAIHFLSSGVRYRNDFDEGLLSTACANQ
jgi:hypothetical protein